LDWCCAWIRDDSTVTAAASATCTAALAGICDDGLGGLDGFGASVDLPATRYGAVGSALIGAGYDRAEVLWFYAGYFFTDDFIGLPVRWKRAGLEPTGFIPFNKSWNKLFLYNILYTGL
jgi:hypothetical protein